MESAAVSEIVNKALATAEAVRGAGIQPSELKDLVNLRDAVRKVATGNSTFTSLIVTNRFVKMSARGDVLPSSATDFAAVLDNTTGLLWSRHIGKADSWAEAKSMAQVDLLGAPAHLPTDKELESLVDRTKRAPACDTTFFGDTKTDDWYWTSTELKSNDASPSDCAWGVHFVNGLVYYSLQNYHGFVRACRRFSPGQ